MINVIKAKLFMKEKLKTLKTVYLVLTNKYCCFIK